MKSVADASTTQEGPVLRSRTLTGPVAVRRGHVTLDLTAHEALALDRLVAEAGVPVTAYERAAANKVRTAATQMVVPGSTRR